MAKGRLRRAMGRQGGGGRKGKRGGGEDSGPDASNAEQQEQLAEEGSYVVQQGDTPRSIAKALTGDASRFQELIQANRHLKGNRPGPGDTIALPESWQAVSTPVLDQVGEDAGETGWAEETEDEEQSTDAEGQYGIVDKNALVRHAPPDLTPNGDTIDYGTLVSVDQMSEDGKYAHVTWKDGEGWTAFSNLGSSKEFDETMEADEQIPLAGLSGLDLSMAIIHNTKGAYLAQQAASLNVEVADLAGVLQIESGGKGFSANGDMIIRFENHILWREWGSANADTYNSHFDYDRDGKAWEGHKFRKESDASWGSFHGNQDKEWEVIEFARELAGEDALLCASYGAAQVMGFNYATLGYENVTDMFDSMQAGIKGQLDGMFAYISNSATCMSGLRSGDYVKFATGYNGSGQAQHYGGLIESAANAYTRVVGANTAGN